MLLDVLFKKKDSPQYEYRVALSKLICDKQQFSLPTIAKEIGINVKTLVGFLQHEYEVEFSTLLRIIDYIDQERAHE